MNARTVEAVHTHTHTHTHTYIYIYILCLQIDIQYKENSVLTRIYNKIDSINLSSSYNNNTG